MEHSKSHPDDSEQAKIYTITKIKSQIKKKSQRDLAVLWEYLLHLRNTNPRLGPQGKTFLPAFTGSSPTSQNEGRKSCNHKLCAFAAKVLSPEIPREAAVQGFGGVPSETLLTSPSLFLTIFTSTVAFQQPLHSSRGKRFSPLISVGIWIVMPQLSGLSSRSLSSGLLGVQPGGLDTCLQVEEKAWELFPA